jgi:hypothetical protein
MLRSILGISPLAGAFGVTCALAVGVLVPLSVSSSALASAKAGGATTTISLGSGQTGSETTNGQDPNTSFCGFPFGEPAPASSAVTLDPGETNCASQYVTPSGGDQTFPTSPYVVSATQASSNSWAAPMAGTNWVSIDPTGSDRSVAPPTTCPAGNVPTGNDECQFYLYDATFNVCSTKGIKLTGSMMSDNLAGVFLNSHFITEQTTGTGFSYDGVNPPASNFTTPTPFSTGANFVTGLNTIDFVVWDSTISSTGLDYAVTIVIPAKDQCGTLKICKVADTPALYGQDFNFKVSGGLTASTTVPAGPAPGGWCEVAGQGLGSVTVAETIPTGDVVTGITSTGGGHGNLGGGTITTKVASGKVTEVTYTDQGAKQTTGYLEICKSSPSSSTGVGPPSTFTFAMSQPWLVINSASLVEPVTVPANACTSAMPVAAGQVQVDELASPTESGTVTQGTWSWSMASCSAIPAADLQGCSPAPMSQALVNVAAGGVSDETILTITDQPSEVTG